MITKLVDAEAVRPIQVVTEPASRSVEPPVSNVVASNVAARNLSAPNADPPRIPQRRSWAWLAWLLFWAALGVGVYFGYPYAKPFFAAKQPVKRDKPPVNVIVAKVTQGDIDLYLNGLGTVAPLNTVTVRARVEGELINIPYHEGELVKQGDLIAEIDSRPYKVQLTQAQGQLAKDEAALTSAQLDLDRYNSLIGSKAVNQQQVDAQLALVQQGQATIQIDRGKIDEINLNIKYCRITAPIAGSVGLRSIDLGNLVRANEPNGLAVITQLQPIAVTFSIPQDDIERLQKQMSRGKAVLVEAYDKRLDSKLGTGKVLAVDNQVDAGTGTLKIKAEFPNSENLLFPNQFVNARLLVETLSGATLVAPAAVQRGPADMNYVYVVTSKQSVELREVKLGPTEADRTVITAGLKPGETVVVNGVDKLKPGEVVNVAKPDKTASGTPAVGQAEGARDQPLQPASAKPASAQDHAAEAAARPPNEATPQSARPGAAP